MAATSRSETRTVRGYAALGDSFSAGAAGSVGSGVTPFPDLLAAALAAAHPGLRYRNLAAAGATSTEVRRDQLGPALALRPDLVTVVCGANDVLLAPRPDIGLFAANLGAVLDALRDGLPGAAIVTATVPDLSRFLPLRPRSRERVSGGLRALAEAARAIARRRGVPCLDAAAHPGAGDAGNFAADGVHPSPAGARRTAAALALLLEHRFAIPAHPIPEAA